MSFPLMPHTIRKTLISPAVFGSPNWFSNSGNNSVYSSSSVNLGVPAADRFVIVASSTNNLVPSSVVLNGVTLDEIIADTNCAIHAGLVPTGTVVTLTVTFPSNAGRFYGVASPVTGLISLDPVAVVSASGTTEINPVLAAPAGVFLTASVVGNSESSPRFTVPVGSVFTSGTEGIGLEASEHAYMRRINVPTTEANPVLTVQRPAGNPIRMVAAAWR